MSTREELERKAAVARDIAADCQSDAVALDSTPFTPMVATLAEEIA